MLILLIKIVLCFALCYHFILISPNALFAKVNREVGERRGGG